MIPREYYLLALSQNLVRLYEVTKDKATRLGAGVLPENIQKALWMDDPEKSVQSHTTKSRGTVTATGIMFHGQGDIKDSKKINLSRFLNIIDKSVNAVLTDKTKPLILFCDKGMFPIYKKLTKYPVLPKNFVAGNPDNLKRLELLKKVKNLYSLK